MGIEKLIERLRNNNIENNCHDCALGYYAFEAATALSTLQAENKSLRVLAELGNTRAKDYRVMRDRAVEAEEENKKLRAELEQAREKNAGLTLALLTECAPNPDCLGDDEWRAIRAELEQVNRENNALWTYIEIVDREYRRYMDRGYIDRLDELKKVWKRGQKED